MDESPAIPPAPPPPSKTGMWVFVGLFVLSSGVAVFLAVRLFSSQSDWDLEMKFQRTKRENERLQRELNEALSKEDKQLEKSTEDLMQAFAEERQALQKEIARGERAREAVEAEWKREKRNFRSEVDRLRTRDEELVKELDAARVALKKTEQNAADIAKKLATAQTVRKSYDELLQDLAAAKESVARLRTITMEIDNEGPALSNEEARQVYKALEEEVEAKERGDPANIKLIEATLPRLRKTSYESDGYELLDDQQAHRAKKLYKQAGADLDEHRADVAKRIEILTAAVRDKRMTTYYRARLQSRLNSELASQSAEAREAAAKVLYETALANRNRHPDRAKDHLERFQEIKPAVEGTGYQRATNKIIEQLEEEMAAE